METGNVCRVRSMESGVIVGRLLVDEREVDYIQSQMYVKHLSSKDLH